MRPLTLAIAFIFVLICSTTNIFAQSNQVNGTWVPVKLEIDGNALPPATFEKQKLIISDTAYTFIAESVDKGTLKYNNGKMDIYGKEGPNAGRHITTIYKFENDQLVICYNLAGDKYPEAFETKGKPAYFLAVFKKE